MVLLRSHDLIKVALGGSWYITQRTNWVQHEQENAKMQNEIETTQPVATHIYQIHYAKAEDIAHLLQENTGSLLSKRGQVRLDVRTNIIIVQDIPSRLIQIEHMIKKMDIPVKQVLIESRLANIDCHYERDLGINFTVSQGSNLPTNNTFATNNYSLLVATLADGALLDVRLNALENAGKAEMISNPRLFTTSQHTALIESGEEIPYQQESASGGTTVVFKKAVMSLKITPQILPGNKVLLQLVINQDRPSKLLVRGVPAISTRQINTSVLLKNGQTVVLGGIYETDKEQMRQSIPYLSSIPLLGFIFQQNELQTNKRELLIFVTPKVVPS